MTLKDETLSLVGVQYTAGKEQRNNYSKNEDNEPNQKWCPGMVLFDGERKHQIDKEQYCIETWNVRSMKVKVTQLCLFVSPWTA